MAEDRIFAVDILDEELLKEAISLKANVIVSNERRCDISAYPNIKFVNSEIYRVPGTYKAYEYNQEIINKLYAKYANKFVVNGINIKKALAKLLYWTNYRIGYLHVCLEENAIKGDIVYMAPFLSGNRFRETLKYFKYYLKNNLKHLKHKSSYISNKVKDRKYALLVNDEFEISIFEYLIKTIPTRDLVIFHYNNIDFEQYSFIDKQIEKVDLSVIQKCAHQPLINPLRISPEELNAVNIIARDWQNISNEIEQYRYIKQTSVSTIIINVGENLPVKNLMRDVLGDRIKVYNTMNGVKSGEAHDGDVYFTKWFVWDEHMKTMLTENYGLDPDSLQITGHLMKDFIRDYYFQDTLGVPFDRVKDKKVISIFSVRGAREEKKEAFRCIYDLLEKDSSCFLIVRPHPLEKEAEFMLPDKPLDNMHFVKYNPKNSKQTLYDQIYLTDLAIVFGSTVAMECQWMGVPAVTFEKKGKSNIYHIDNVHIRHIKSIDELKKELANVKKKQVIENDKNGGYEVAENILHELLQP